MSKPIYFIILNVNGCLSIYYDMYFSSLKAARKSARLIPNAFEIGRKNNCGYLYFKL